jgi:hypothetical protein
MNYQERYEELQRRADVVCAKMSQIAVFPTGNELTDVQRTQKQQLQGEVRAEQQAIEHEARVIGLRVRFVEKGRAPAYVDGSRDATYETQFT